MTALPAAFKDDMGDEASSSYVSGMGDSFFGSEKSETDLGGGISMTTEFTWGGGTGWVMAFVAFIILIIALIMVATTKPEPAPMAPAGPEPQPAYQPPTTPPPP